MMFESVKAFIDSHEKFILTTHETPDGDAIGSEYAMLKALQKLGKTAMVFNADPMPKNFRFIDETNEIKKLPKPSRLPRNLEEFGLFILDANDTGNIGGVSRLILPKVSGYFILDHHDSDTDILSPGLVRQSASSTAEILFQLFQELEIEVDKPMANALYTAIVYDTGSFIYPKTSALTFRIAHSLVLAGVNPNRIYTQVYETKSIESLLLQSSVLATLELCYDNHVAVLTMLKSLLEETGASYEEGHQLINIPLAAESVEVSVFFKENLEGMLRCSLRSKGSVDVAEVARSFGGGGHKTAAGFKCRESLDEVRSKLLNHLRSAVL
jgi:phosphoesterase RecJ-like protein